MGDSMRTIHTFGLTHEQNKFVDRCTPLGCRISIVEAQTDLIAVDSSVSIINTSLLDFDYLDGFIRFYHEINGCTAQKIIWVDVNYSSRDLPENFIPYETFEEMGEKLESILHKQIKLGLKIMDYSRRLVDLMKVLALIRKYPGISINAIGALLNMKPQTIQKNIITLKMAGEWIEYDVHKKGWKLFDNVSYFLGDRWEPEKSSSSSSVAHVR